MKAEYGNEEDTYTVKNVLFDYFLKCKDFWEPAYDWDLIRNIFWAAVILYHGNWWSLLIYASPSLNKCCRLYLLFHGCRSGCTVFHLSTKKRPFHSCLCTMMLFFRQAITHSYELWLECLVYKCSLSCDVNLFFSLRSTETNTLASLS